MRMKLNSHRILKIAETPLLLLILKYGSVFLPTETKFCRAARITVAFFSGRDKHFYCKVKEGIQFLFDIDVDVRSRNSITQRSLPDV